MPTNQDIQTGQQSMRFSSAKNSNAVGDVVSSEDRQRGGWSALGGPPPPQQNSMQRLTREELQKLIREEEYQERAGIKEFLGNLPREQAEREAREELQKK